MSLPFLTGVRVVDLSQYIPGPYAALMLADLGAEVVKVEPPGGDPMRQLGPRDADGISPLWKLMNGGKTVVEIDLKETSGRQALEELLRQADALIESYRPGVMDRLGFTRQRIEELNPRLVHAALSGYGQTGPWRLRTGHDLNYMALAGGLAQSGPKQRPLMAAPPTADFASGLQTAMTVCAALFGRMRTDRGTYLDLSLAETVVAWQSATLTSALRPGFEPARATNLLNGGAACYQVYRAMDGRFVTLAAIEEKFWRNFCEAVGRPDLIARQWETMPQTVLIDELGAIFATKGAVAWETMLGPVECCFGIVVEPRDVPRHPQIAARGMIDARESMIEALFPAHVDGKSPDRRAPAVIVPVADVLGRWTTNR